jgi:hypothetical protein
LEFEERGALDDRLGALFVLNAGELHDDAIVAQFADVGLEHAKLVDAVVDDLECLVGGVTTRFRRHGALPILNLEGQVHAALQVESEGDAVEDQESN